MKILIIYILFTVSIYSQQLFWWTSDSNPVTPTPSVNITDGSYQFPDSGRFYSPWSVGHPWLPALYNSTSNTIDITYQARDILDVTIDTNFIYLQSFDLDGTDFNARVKTYENRHTVAAPYAGSEYDWDHFYPSLGRKGTTYLCLFASHGTDFWGFTSDLSLGSISDKDTILSGSLTYAQMSYEFTDTMWINIRGSGLTDRTMYTWDGSNYSTLINFADFTEMNNASNYWVYTAPPFYEQNGNEKRAVVLFTLRSDETPTPHYQRYGIIEIKRNAGVNTYFNSYGNPVSVPIDSALFVDSLQIFDSGANFAFNWSKPAVLGDSIAFPIMVEDTNAKLKFLRRIETVWDTLDVLTIPNVNPHKWKDWYFYNPDVYFIIGGSGMYDAFTSDLTMPKSSDTLYLYKYANLFGEGSLSVLDTIYSQASGDQVGAFHASFIQNDFTETTEFLGVLIWEHLGNPVSRMDTTGGNGYYYFKNLGE